MKNLENIIRNTAGKFFTVVFEKKNGGQRVLNGRLGVVNYLKGGVKTTNDDKYITVFDVQIGEYRLVNKNTIKEVRFGKQVFR